MALVYIDKHDKLIIVDMFYFTCLSDLEGSHPLGDGVPRPRLLMACSMEHTYCFISVMILLHV